MTHWEKPSLWPLGGERTYDFRGCGHRCSPLAPLFRLSSPWALLLLSHMPLLLHWNNKILVQPNIIRPLPHNSSIKSNDFNFQNHITKCPLGVWKNISVFWKDPMYPLGSGLFSDAGPFSWPNLSLYFPVLWQILVSSHLVLWKNYEEMVQSFRLV